MKIRIFNRGLGWYLTANNYKDQEDKAYVNVHFTQQCGEPDFKPNDDNYDTREIEIIEGKHNCYKGKVGLTIFKWKYADEPKSDPNQDFVQSIQGTKYAEQFGASSEDISISPNDLPFY